MRFEWDPEKNSKNIKKHGVSFEQPVYVFADINVLSVYDAEHSEEEERWVSIGMIPSMDIFIVLHTERYHNDGEYIRIISARKATKNEITQYYEYIK